MTQEMSRVRHMLQRLETLSKASVDSMHSRHFFGVDVHLDEQTFARSVIGPCLANITMSSLVQAEVCEMCMPTWCYRIYNLKWFENINFFVKIVFKTNKKEDNSKNKKYIPVVSVIHRNNLGLESLTAKCGTR